MPNTPEDIENMTDALAAGPASAAVDGRAASAHKLGDMIDYEKYRRNLNAAEAPPGGGIGVKFFQLRPPGTV
jgi:hypothetical protein